MAAPAQVTTPSPANSSTTESPAVLALTWAAAAGATSYNVYFKKTGAAAWTTSLGQAGLSYALSGLLHGTLYYWRIDSVNADGVTTGVQWSFTTIAIDSPTPSAVNAMALKMRVVAVSNNKVYYEAVV
jgi:hypothetical protein